MRERNKVYVSVEAIVERAIIKDTNYTKNDKLISKTYDAPVQKYTDTYETNEGKKHRLKLCLTEDIPENIVKKIKRNVKKYCNINGYRYGEVYGVMFRPADCIVVTYAD